MPKDQETPVEQTTETLTETPSSETPPQSEESSEGTGLVFEEPDFAAITDFVEGTVEEDVIPPVVAEGEEIVTPPVEEVPLEEVATPVEPSESIETPKEDVIPPVVEEPKDVPEVPEKIAEPEAVKLPTREDLEGMYKDHREKVLPELEKIFTLSDEEAAALDEQPSKVLPKLAAQMQYDVMLSTYNAVIAALPSVMGTFTKVNTLATQAHDQFMDRWPDLTDAKAEPAVKAAINAYRGANPRASLEDTIQNAGVMAMINLGLDPTKKAVAKVPTIPKPIATPPKPVSPTGQSPIPPTSSDVEPNEFAELAEVFLNEMS